MNRLLLYLIVGVVALTILVAAGPTLVSLAHAALPLVIAGGVVAVVLRLVFFHTRRW
jgi:hypothetical protein